MRVIVTGSRTWDEPQTVWQALDYHYGQILPGEPFTVVHGACPMGADMHAHAWCETWKTLRPNVIEEAHPADWKTYGKPAGFKRNTKMAQAGADVALAFIRSNSRGARHCARACESAGIPTARIQYGGG